MAPIITKILSGGASDLINSITGAIDTFVDTKAEKSERDIKLQEIVLSHEEKMSEIVQKELEAQIENTKNARDREIQISTSDKAPLLNKIITPVLALIVTIGGGWLFYSSSSPDERTAIIGVIMLVLGYYFGSTVSSHAKDDTIKNLTK